MAKSNFSSRFPHFGIFLVIALAIAIPLTVWSLNNVSTQTQQGAQVLTCAAAGGVCMGACSYPITGTTGCMAPTVCCGTQPTTSVVCKRCTIKQTDGKYLVGGVCGTDGKTLCQCSGSGTIKSSSRCTTSCKVNAGTYDTCATTTDLCSRCKIKQANNKYLIGGACSFDGKTLCQCSGSGTTTSKYTCSWGCQVNVGTYDTCYPSPKDQT